MHKRQVSTSGIENLCLYVSILCVLPMSVDIKILYIFMSVCKYIIEYFNNYVLYVTNIFFCINHTHK